MMRSLVFAVCVVLGACANSGADRLNLVQRPDGTVEIIPLHIPHTPHTRFRQHYQ